MSNVARKRAPTMLMPEVVTHSPLSVCTLFEPLLVRMPSTTAIGMISTSRNAVVTRFDRSG